MFYNIYLEKPGIIEDILKLCDVKTLVFKG